MLKRYRLSLFLFRRDLRLQDNTALIEAVRDSEQVIPAFIFDTQQIEQNDYFSARAFTFMLQSLQGLQAEIVQTGGRLYFFQGAAQDVVEQLLLRLPIDAVYINRDYTPFSTKRDQLLEQAALAQQRGFHAYDDLLLHEPGSILKKDGTPYTIYTPFKKRASDIPVLAPVSHHFKNFYSQDVACADEAYLNAFLKQYNQPLCIPGTREQGKIQLRRIDELENYAELRNVPAFNATTHLSPHNKFGTLSIREVYHYIKKTWGIGHTLVSELYWRDFFTHIAYFFPRVFKGAFHERYQAIAWSQNTTHFAAWCQGHTGFPIVDAGMRELNATGYMHNRLRMITASFLVKDLHINWQWGERYFAQQLIDYDPAVNNGNWQWAASTGCDAQPYFRVFNPALQQKKFDPDEVYLKKWLPEWTGNPLAYPPPVVDHRVASAKAKALYKI